ncbi:MAG: hypothetical protein L3J79_05470 [Candidatus Marinimicrobia bacterium]|nr:hypothetical protein [Candidatus Neomarinimicrobiota bacterium]
MKKMWNILFVLLFVTASVFLAGIQEKVYARGEEGNSLRTMNQNGWVYRVVDSTTLVIDDMTYRLSPSASFFDSDNNAIGLSALRRKVFVAFSQVNGVISEVHILPQQDERHGPGALPSATKPTENTGSVILENGVWKN